MTFFEDGVYKLFCFHIYRPVLTRERKVTSTVWVSIQWTGRLSMVRTLFVCVLGDSENLISVSGDLS